MKDWTAHNALIDALLPDIEVYQAVYIATHPYYFQGLKTHAVVPVENDTANLLDQKPPDKQTTWTETGLIGRSYPFSVEIHEYVAPDTSKGWQVLFRSSDGTDEYIRSVGYGVNAVGLTHDWGMVKKH